MFTAVVYPKKKSLVYVWTILKAQQWHNLPVSTMLWDSAPLCGTGSHQNAVQIWLQEEHRWTRNPRTDFFLSIWKSTKLPWSYTGSLHLLLLRFSTVAGESKHRKHESIKLRYKKKIRQSQKTEETNKTRKNAANASTSVFPPTFFWVTVFTETLDPLWSGAFPFCGELAAFPTCSCSGVCIIPVFTASDSHCNLNSDSFGKAQQKNKN